MSRQHWSTAKIKDLSEYLTVGFVGSMSNLFQEDGIPLLRGQNIKPYVLDMTNLKYISEETHRKWRKSALKAGDVVIVRVGYPGTACVIPEGLGDLNAASLVIVRPAKDKLDPYYLSYVLNSDWGKANVLGRLVGAAQQVFNTSTAAELEIPAPDISTQRRIAGILSAYDELIANNQRRIAVLEQMARALYREWFVYFRAPGVVMKDGEELPEGWEETTVGAAADILRGRSYRTEDLGEDEGLPFLNLKCLVRHGGFRRSGLKWYTGDYKESHVARKGDIVMAVTDMTQERMIVARAAWVPSLGQEFGIISMDLVKIEPKPHVPKVFLYAFLRYSGFADEVKQHANGANVLHLAPDRIRDYPIHLPPESLMQRFADTVGSILDLIDTLDNQSENLSRTRDLLLPRLMSGRVDAKSIIEA